MGRTSDAKERILASAQELFYARSCENVSVQNICEHAKVKKGSFYHYFRSKAALTIAVSDQFAKQAGASLMQEVFHPSIPPLERILALFDWAYGFQAASKSDFGKVLGCLNLNLCTELATQDTTLRNQIAEIFASSINIIEASLAEAVEKGELESINCRERAEGIFAYLQGALSLAKAQNDPEVIRRLAKGVPLFLEPDLTHNKISPTSIQEENET